MKNEPIDIRIVKLAEIPDGTGFDRWEMLRHDGSSVSVEISAQYTTGRNDRLTLELQARYTTVRMMVRRTLMTMKIAATFEVAHLGSITEIGSDGMLLPSALTIATMNVAIGALRGMIAARTAHTFLANYPLPLFDIRALVSNMTAAPADARGRLPEVTVRAAL